MRALTSGGHGHDVLTAAVSGTAAMMMLPPSDTRMNLEDFAPAKAHSCR